MWKSATGQKASRQLLQGFDSQVRSHNRLPALMVFGVVSMSHECQEEIGPPQMLLPRFVASPTHLRGVPVQDPGVERVVPDAVCNVSQTGQQFRIEGDRNDLNAQLIQTGDSAGAQPQGYGLCARHELGPVSLSKELFLTRLRT